MADYDWFDRGPTEAEIEATKWRPLGFDAVYDYTSIGKVSRVQYYRCRRGCGCVVWSPEVHIKNVCTEFNPVVGTGPTEAENLAPDSEWRYKNWDYDG